MIGSSVAIGLTLLAQLTDQALAQSLFDEGIALMEQGRFDEACPKLAESQRLDPGGGTLLNLGSCYERQGKLASAFTTFNEALSQALRDGRREREAAARDHLSAIQPQLSHVVLHVAEPAPGFELKVDGAVVRPAAWGSPLLVDPGKHTIEASAPQHEPFSTTIEITKTHEDVAVDVPKLAKTIVIAPHPTIVIEQPDRTQRTLGFISGGVGIASIALGAFAGGAAFVRKGDSDAQCPTRMTCSDAGVNAMRDAETLAWVSNIAITAGVAFVVTGVVLLITAPKAKTKLAFQGTF